MLQPSSSGNALQTCVYIFTALTTIALALRFHAAKLTGRKIYADDALVAVGWACTFTQGVCNIWAVYNGMGHHVTELNEQQLNVQFKMILISSVTWLLGTVMIKLSLLFLYVRIFHVSRGTRLAAQVLIALVASYCVAFFPVFLTNCHPIDQQWNPSPEGSCRDLSIEEFASVGANLILDISVVILPLPVLWQLQMVTRNKVFLSVMFSLGIITIAVMCWRIAVTVQVMGDLDFTLSLATIAVISMLELWLGIICACMPTLSPLLNVYVTPALKRLVSKYSSLKPSAQHGSSSQGQPAGRPRPTSQRRVKGKWSLASSLFNSVGSQERGTGQHASFYGGQRIPEAQITGSAFYSGSEHELIGDPTGGREPKSINAVTNFWQEVENLDAPAVPVPKVTHNWQ